MTVKELLKASEHIHERVILLNPLDVDLILMALLCSDATVYIDTAFKRYSMTIVSKAQHEENKKNNGYGEA